MIKEELEKEAEEWVISNTEIYDDKFGIECKVKPQAEEAYLAGAEPREKRIADLEKENAELKDYAIQLKTETAKRDTELTKQLLELDKERIKAKELLAKAIKNTWSIDCSVVDEINKFLNEMEK